MIERIRNYLFEEIETERILLNSHNFILFAKLPIMFPIFKSMMNQGLLMSTLRSLALIYFLMKNNMEQTFWKNKE